MFLCGLDFRHEELPHRLFRSDYSGGFMHKALMDANTMKLYFPADECNLLFVALYTSPAPPCAAEQSLEEDGRLSDTRRRITNLSILLD